MNRILSHLLLIVLLLAGSSRVQGEQTAAAHLFYGSLRMHKGKCSCGFGLNYYLHFSTYNTDDPSRANEVLAPLPAGSAYTHWSYLILEDPSMYGSSTPVMLDVPKLDANGDGIADIFETSQTIAASTSGTYENDWGQQVISAVWNRGAGSTAGTCELTLRDSILGDMGPFHATFDIVEYAGQLKYTPGSNLVSATVSLVKQGDQSYEFQGALQLIKSPSDRFNELTYENFTWTHSINGDIPFGSGTLTRVPGSPNTYQTLLPLENGGESGWTLSIEDTNDADHNGIPDLSDDLPAPKLPRRPRLTVSLTPAELRLGIEGDVGHTHRIFEASSPNATAWTLTRTVSLSSDPQVISLPLPAGQPKFWKVDAQ